MLQLVCAIDIFQGVLIGLSIISLFTLCASTVFGIILSVVFYFKKKPQKKLWKAIGRIVLISVMTVIISVVSYYVYSEYINPCEDHIPEFKCGNEYLY